MSTIQEDIIAVSKLAGKAIMETYNKIHTVTEKADRSPVTEADILSDRIIAKELEKYGWPVLSEESEDDLSRLDSEKVWIVDSLDGTMDFIQKTGEFSVMIGLAERGEAVAGAVFLPAKNIVYFAEKGKGAFRQISGDPPERLNVSLQTDIKNAIAVASRNHFDEQTKQLTDKLGISDFRMRGSNGLKMCIIAEGGADIFINPTNKLGQWDLCAPQIIVEEAGGKVTGIRNELILYNGKDLRNPYGIAVTNGKLHETIINLIS